MHGKPFKVFHISTGQAQKQPFHAYLFCCDCGVFSQAMKTGWLILASYGNNCTTWWDAGASWISGCFGWNLQGLDTAEFPTQVIAPTLSINCFKTFSRFQKPIVIDVSELHSHAKCLQRLCLSLSAKCSCHAFTALVVPKSRLKMVVMKRSRKMLAVHCTCYNCNKWPQLKHPQNTEIGTGVTEKLLPFLWFHSMENEWPQQAEVFPKCAGTPDRVA